MKKEMKNCKFKTISLALILVFTSLFSIHGTDLVNVASDNTQANADSNSRPYCSADGRYVVFSSTASNLVAGDANGCEDVFLHDRNTNTTTRITSTKSGGGETTKWSKNPSISADGRYIVFNSEEKLVAADTNGVWDTYVYDRNTSAYTRVSEAADGTQGNHGKMTNLGTGGTITNTADVRYYTPFISDDGNQIVYACDATNLVAGDTNAKYDIFVYDRSGAVVVDRVSVSGAGAQANGASYQFSMTGDGRYVAFNSAATNLVANDTNSTWDTFVYDRQADTIERVSISSGGAQADGESVCVPFLSSDGRYVAFTSKATNLVSSDTNKKMDVFVYDRQTDTIERASVSSSETEANNSSFNPSISGDGRYVVFASTATNLVPNTANGAVNIYVRDRINGQTWCTSLSSDGTMSNGRSDLPSIASGGSRVVYRSDATNLIANVNNSKYNIYSADKAELVYDLTVNPPENGLTVPSGTSQLTPGVKHTITATPAANYHFKRWVLVSGNATIGDVNSAQTTIIIGSNTVLKAEFEHDTGNLTLTVFGNGSINPSGTLSVNTATPVAVTATPIKNYHFVKWVVTSGQATIADSESTSTTITINSSATVTAEFTHDSVVLTMEVANGPGSTVPSVGKTLVDTYTPVPISIAPDSNYELERWIISGTGTIADPTASRTTVTISANSIVTARLRRKTAKVTIAVTPGGGGTTNLLAGHQHTFNYGISKTITATPSPHYYFVNWSYEGGVQLEDENSATTEFTVNGDGTLTANFTHETTLLNITVEGNGSTSPAAGANTVDTVTPINVIATPDDHNRFVKWIYSGNLTVKNETTATIEVTLTGKANLTAVFEYYTPPEANLTIAVSGNGSTSPEPGDHTLKTLEPIPIKAEVNSSHIFSHWSSENGNAVIHNPSAIETKVTINEKAKITAHFVHPIVLNVGKNEVFKTIKTAVSAVREGKGYIINLVDPIHTEKGVVVNKSVIIQGQGADRTIVQADSEPQKADDRVFLIEPEYNVLIRNMTIRHGNPASGNGGGLYNQGNLTVDSCAVANNNANGDGGGICNSGKINIKNSYFANNTALEHNGGGIANAENGQLIIHNSTLTGNNAGNGGGIYSISALSVYNSTLTENTAQNGGGISNSEGECKLFSSIIAGNQASVAGADFNGKTFASHCLLKSSNQTEITDGDQNIIGEDPLINPKAFYGGSTMTFALQEGSPAIDTGSNLDELSYDQRGSGFSRTIGDGTDIGAYEFGTDLKMVKLTIVADSQHGVTIPGAGTISVMRNQPVSITAYPLPGSQFLGWKGNRRAKFVDATSLSTSVSLTGDAVITANFAVDNATVQVSVSGLGTVDPQPGKHSFAKDLSIPLTAVPGEGYYFVNWIFSENIAIADSDSADTSMTVSGDGAIIANFIPIQTPSIVLINPDNGGSYQHGQNINITWKASTAISKIKLELIKDDLTDSIITEETDNNGLFKWAIPAELSTGNFYKIRILGLGINGNNSSLEVLASDESNVSFAVKNDNASLVLTSPNSGEIWTSGDTQTIAWSSANLDGQIKIELFQQGALVQVIADAVAVNNGTYSWTIPIGLTADNKYMVKITSLSSPSTHDISDHFFTIVTSNKAILTLKTIPEGVTTTNPAAGQYTVKIGGQINTSVNIPMGYKLVKWLVDGKANISSPLEEKIAIKIHGDATVTAFLMVQDGTSVFEKVKVNVDTRAENLDYIKINGGTIPSIVTEQDIANENFQLLVDGQIIDLKHNGQASTATDQRKKQYKYYSSSEETGMRSILLFNLDKTIRTWSFTGSKLNLAGKIDYRDGIDIFMVIGKKPFGSNLKMSQNINWQFNDGEKLPLNISGVPMSGFSILKARGKMISSQKAADLVYIPKGTIENFKNVDLNNKQVSVSIDNTTHIFSEFTPSSHGKNSWKAINTEDFPLLLILGLEQGQWKFRINNTHTTPDIYPGDGIDIRLRLGDYEGGIRLLVNQKIALEYPIK